jgi:twitching motility protein PilT
MLMTLQDILIEAINKSASDVNITQKQKLAYRIKNDIVIYHDETIVSLDAIQRIVQDLTSSNSTLTDLYRPQEKDGSYKFIYKNEFYFFRYNISLTNSDIHITVRRLINKVPSMEQVQLDNPDMIDFREDIASMKEGLYLLVGATGSGKTTTMVTLLDYILERNKIKAVTLESPIEFYFNPMKYVNSVIFQKEIGKDTDSFYSGVVAAMRQNPDLIFVGEVRDKDTAIACLNASLTGHTVIATLHANSIEKTKDRMGYLLDGITNDFSFINGIVFQKLVKENDVVIAKRDVYIKSKMKI